MSRDAARVAALWAASTLLACGGGEEVVHLSAAKGAEVTLEAPPMADDAAYEWRLASAPPGPPPSLIADGARATFVERDHAGTAEVVREERSGDILFATRFVIEVGNRPPEIGEITTSFPLAGGDITVTSTASDPDGESLVYHWEITGQPPGASATIGEGSAVSTRFRADRVGHYQVTLSVEDGDDARASSTLDFDVYGPLTDDTVIGASGDSLSRPALSASRDELVFAGGGLFIFNLVDGSVTVDDRIIGVNVVDGTPSGRYVWLRTSSQVRLYDLATREVVFTSATATPNLCQASDQALYWTTATTADNHLHALVWQTGNERVSPALEGLLYAPVLSPALDRVFVASWSNVAPGYAQLALDAAPAVLESGESPIDWREAGRMIGTLDDGERVVTSHGTVAAISTSGPPAAVGTFELVDPDPIQIDLAHDPAHSVFAVGLGQHVRVHDDGDYQLERDLDLTFWTNPEQPIWVYPYRDGFLLAALKDYTLRTIYVANP